MQTIIKFFLKIAVCVLHFLELVALFLPFFLFFFGFFLTCFVLSLTFVSFLTSLLLCFPPYFPSSSLSFLPSMRRKLDRSENKGNTYRILIMWFLYAVPWESLTRDRMVSSWRDVQWRTVKQSMQYCFTFVILSARMSVALDVASRRLRYRLASFSRRWISVAVSAVMRCNDLQRMRKEAVGFCFNLLPHGLFWNDTVRL